jgi:membrane protease YdiL (CAAX protease family)
MLVAAPLFGTSFSGILAKLSDFSDPSSAGLLRFFQFVQEFGVFIIPPLLAALFFSSRPAGYLKMDKASTLSVWVITFILMFISLPLISYTIMLNESMQLPAWMAGMETWMKETEEQAAQLTELFLADHSFQGYLLNLVMIAILPSIGEEFLFRGLFQQLFGEWFKNIHVAIIISSLLFGAMHMQFYGILPRTLLGIVLGYLCYYSGSIWVPVFAHFVNNAGALTISFLEKNRITESSWQDFGSTESVWMALLSLILTFTGVWMVRQISLNKQNAVP